MKFEFAPDVEMKIKKIVEVLDLKHVDADRIVCMRSSGSTSNSYARIWELPRIWQKALGVRAHYVIEVLAEKFDKLDGKEQLKTLLHEVMHIPLTFSGSVVPHKCFGKRIDDNAVERLFRTYQNRLIDE